MTIKFFKNKKNIFILCLISMAAILVFNSTFFAVLHNTFLLRKLNKKVVALDVEYEVLNKEYKQILSGDKSYLEGAARVKYNMATDGEIEFRVKK